MTAKDRFILWGMGRKLFYTRQFRAGLIEYRCSYVIEIRVFAICEKRNEVNVS